MQTRIAVLTAYLLAFFETAMRHTAYPSLRFGAKGLTPMMIGFGVLCAALLLSLIFRENSESQDPVSSVGQGYRIDMDIYKDRLFSVF